MIFANRMRTRQVIRAFSCLENFIYIHTYIQTYIHTFPATSSDFWSFLFALSIVFIFSKFRAITMGMNPMYPRLNFHEHTKDIINEDPMPPIMTITKHSMIPVV